MSKTRVLKPTKCMLQTRQWHSIAVCRGMNLFRPKCLKYITTDSLHAKRFINRIITNVFTTKGCPTGAIGVLIYSTATQNKFVWP